MITQTDKFWAFFQPIAVATPNVVYTMMSDGDRLDRWWADSRSEETYPGIFVIRPRYVGSNDAVMTTYFDVVFYVLVQGKLAEYTDQDAAYHQAEEIVQHIVKEIKHQSYSGKCFFDFSTFKIEPILYQTTDATWGYEVHLKLGLTANDIFC